MENIIAKLLQDFEQGKMSRRQLIQSLAMTAAVAGATGTAVAAEGEKKAFKAVAVNHISYQVADYARTRDFYADLLGMQVSHDEGKGQCYLAFGDTFLLARTPSQRGGRGGKAGDAPTPPREIPKPPHIDHMAYTIEGWNKDQVEHELQRRGYKQQERVPGQF